MQSAAFLPICQRFAAALDLTDAGLARAGSRACLWVPPSLSLAPNVLAAAAA